MTSIPNFKVMNNGETCFNGYFIEIVLIMWAIT